MFGQFGDFTYLCTMKLKDNEYEVYVDGKLLRVVKGHKRFENYLEHYKEMMYNKGYTIVEEYVGHFIIFVNRSKMKCQFLAYRNWLGISDKKGNKIYYGDYLEDECGNSVMFCNCYNPNNYVISVANKYEHVPDIEFDNLDICKEMGISVKGRVFKQFPYV